MKSLLRWCVSIACALTISLPLLWLVAASFRESDSIFRSTTGWFTSRNGWTVHNYANAWRRAQLGSALTVSSLQLLIIIVLGLAVNAPCAYAFARLQFRGRELLFSMIIALLILPVETLVVPLFLTARDLGLTSGRYTAIAGLALPFAAKAFNIYFLRQQFLSWPTELEEAAVLDGAGTWRIFWSVALPSLRPALATVLLLDIVAHWSDFLWPLLVTTRDDMRTVQLSLASLFTEPPIDWGAVLACGVMATLPVMLGFRFFQRYLVLADARAGLR